MDDLFGDVGNDTLYGDEGDDDALAGDLGGGSGGNDSIYGGPGNDGPLVGGDGKNIVRGEDGNDVIVVGNISELTFKSKNDIAVGGNGDDLIEACDGPKDFVLCGAGIDTVYFDRGIDTVLGCEIQNPPEASSAKQQESGLRLTVAAESLVGR